MTTPRVASIGLGVFLAVTPVSAQHFPPTDQLELILKYTAEDGGEHVAADGIARFRITAQSPAGPCRTPS